MKLENMNLQEMIDKSEKHDACPPELEKLREFSSMEELLETASDEEKAQWAYWYARKVIKGRWMEAEPFIMQGHSALWYASHVIGGRWLEAEPVIMKNPCLACRYAEYIIKGRWVEAEPTIIQRPESALWYSEYVLKSRWLEAEPDIMKSPWVWKFYCKVFPEAAI